VILDVTEIVGRHLQLPQGPQRRTPARRAFAEGDLLRTRGHG
jgi:hypothetical protein